MKRDSNGSAVLLWAALAVFVVWLALLGGGCCGEGLGLFEWLNVFSAALETPFSIHITPYTKKFVLISSAFYGFAVAWYYSEKGNRRPGEEHGSAYWGRPKEVCAHFRTKKHDRYLLISKHIRISMNVRALPPQHQVNANILVIGGSGAGKTRFFIKPNLMQAECSYIVCDPKGETYRAVGGLLEKMGYEVTIFNLIDMKQSDCYNPFAYLHTDIDAFRLINTLIQNTTPQKSQTSDPFWDKAETAFLSALILYLFHEAPESERNFGTLMYMVINAEAREEDESYRSPVDLLFDDLERVDEDHIAVKNWKVFKQAGPETSCQGLFNQIHKKATKKPQKSARSTFMLLTLRRVGLLFPGKDFFANGLVFRQPFKEGVPAPLYLGQFQRVGGLFSVIVAGHLQHIHRRLGKQHFGKLVGGVNEYFFLDIPLFCADFQQQIAQLIRPEPFQIGAFPDVVGKHRVNPLNLFLFRFFVQHFHVLLG